MPKSIPTALLTDIQRNLTTLAVALSIRRRDGKSFHITNHDQDVTLQSTLYRHDIPFNLPSIDSGSQLAIDNTQIMLFADDAVFLKSEFEAGLFDHSECEIYLFDYESPAHGIVSLRKGWFGEIIRSQHNVIRITVTGLLKILDFEVGRVYQPSCDADLGDRRCKVAINESQSQSSINPGKVGDWSYRYDTALMTPITITNPSFNVDGDRTILQAITGWTKSSGAQFVVQTTNPLTGFNAYDNRALWGTDELSDPGFEQYVYQDFTYTAAGMSTADIDAGKLSIQVVTALAQPVYLLDPVRMKVEQINSVGDVIDTLDTRYVFLDVENAWRERSLAGPVIAGTRTFRITLYMRKEDGLVVNGGFDNVRAYFWDHTSVTPYAGSVHRLSRIVAFDESAAYYPVNASFEPTVANALNPSVTGWVVTAGSWWRTLTASGALLAPADGSRFLMGGDDGTLVQRTDTIHQDITLTTGPKIDLTRVALGQYFFKLALSVGWDTTSAVATVRLEQYNVSNSLIDTIDLITAYNPGMSAFFPVSGVVTLKAACTKVRIKLIATSPIGSGVNKVAFDGIKMWFYDAGRPAKSDPASATGDNATVWDATPGSYTFDGNLVWQATDGYLKHDIVASVIDRKSFIGTAITGVAGTYETGYIRWISGANANQTNIIRQWTSGTKKVKTYFRAAYDIQPGDRYIYVRSCQRRFLEDCKGIFGNQINFRGFPYLPGRLKVDPVGASG